MRLIVLSLPSFFSGELACLEELLSAGLEKLHLRKPGAGEKEMEALLRSLSPRWSSRLVLHGSQALAEKYGIPQVHLSGKEWRATLPGPLAVSASLHSWEELKEAPAFEYVFMSPLFDSISKPGYPAGKDLLQRPSGGYPCPVIGLGGINKDNIACMIREGWEGAALLGWIWQEPGKAAERYKELGKIIEKYSDHGK